MRAEAKDRDLVAFADLPVFGSSVRLVWSKRRWECPEPACGMGSWTEDRPDIAPARTVLTTRAGLWATREVGAEVHTVAYAARQLGVAWHRAGKAPEVRRMALTLVQWRRPILAWHTTGHTNGPVEGLNSLIKKLKRVAAGFRSFANYRLRTLLACGGCNWALLGTPSR